MYILHFPEVIEQAKKIASLICMLLLHTKSKRPFSLLTLFRLSKGRTYMK